MAELDAELQRIDQRVDRAIAEADEFLILAETAYTELHALLATLVEQRMAAIFQRIGECQILGLEDPPDIGRRHLLAGVVGDLLDGRAELDLQPARQFQIVLGFEKIGDAALARLAVDANDRFIGAPQILRVDRQIGHFPDIAVLARGQALLDRVLVRAGKGREHQIADIGVARMDRQLRAVFDRARDLVDLREIETGMNALTVEIERQRHEIDIAGAFAMTEETAFDAIGAGHHAEFGCRHRRAAVVMRMQRQHDAVAPLEIAMHPFDLVGIDVGRRHFDGRRQVDDDLALGPRFPDLGHRIDDFLGEIELGARKDFGTVLEGPVGRGLRGRELLDLVRAFGGDRLDALLALLEDDLAEIGRGGVVDMDDGVLRAAQ